MYATIIWQTLGWLLWFNALLAVLWMLILIIGILMYYTNKLGSFEAALLYVTSLGYCGMTKTDFVRVDD